MTRETDFSLTVTALCPQSSTQLVARPARRRGKGPLCLGLGEAGGIGSKCVMCVESRENHHTIVALESHGRQRHKSHVEASHLGWPVFASKHLLAAEIELPDPHTLSYSLQSGFVSIYFHLTPIPTLPQGLVPGSKVTDKMVYRNVQMT